MQGRLTNFIYDRLLRFLNKLGGDVQIVVNLSADTDTAGTTTARIAATEARLVVSGRSIKGVYKECKTKTPEQIIEEQYLSGARFTPKKI